MTNGEDLEQPVHKLVSESAAKFIDNNLLKHEDKILSGQYDLEREINSYQKKLESGPIIAPKSILEELQKRIDAITKSQLQQMSSIIEGNIESNNEGNNKPTFNTAEDAQKKRLIEIKDILTPEKP
jgi:hypothetical protein